MNFHVGQKVVCIRSGWTNLREGETAPEKGQVLTIRGIGLFPEGAALLFEEIHNPTCALYKANPKEAFFIATKFRPVVERKTETGMAILREILDRETHQDKPPVKRTVHS